MNQNDQQIHNLAVLPFDDKDKMIKIKNDGIRNDLTKHMSPCLVPHWVWSNGEVKKHLQKGACIEAYLNCRTDTGEDLKVRMVNYLV